MQSIIKNEFNSHLKVSQDSMASLTSSIEKAAQICIHGLKNGK